MTSSEPSEPSARSVEIKRLKCCAATTVDPLRVGGLRASTVLRVTTGVAMGAQLIWQRVPTWLALCNAAFVSPWRANTPVWGDRPSPWWISCQAVTTV